MLKAAVFEEFKGATTLLLWGDGEGMALLLRGFDALRSGADHEFSVGGQSFDLTVIHGEGSTLFRNGTDLRWCCSREMIALAAELTEPLLHQVGHQYLDVAGGAEQIIISRDEYPADMC